MAPVYLEGVNRLHKLLGEKMSGRSAEELEVEFGEQTWRTKFLELCDLIEILADCIIPDSYVISDELNAAIRLSESGNVMLDRLTRKEKVNAKDARLMCALSLGHDELFIDVDAIDVERFAAALNTALLDGSIRFPFIFGRSLYDAYAELFEDEKDYLTNEETIKLLDKLPKGVFQYGSFTIGPFGLHRSLSHRSLQCHRRVPAYHCATPTCHSIHAVTLQTGHNATVNKQREKLEAILEASVESSSDWWGLASKLSGMSDSYFGDQRAGVLLPLVGDTLSNSELGSLVADLLDGTRGQLRGAVSPLGLKGSCEDIIPGLSRAQLLQIVLVATEESVSTSLDRLVRRDVIRVPLGDIRRPVINKNVRSGAFRLRAELGHYGVRFLSDDPGLSLLRERRLLSKLYLRAPESEVQELEWQLRGIEIDDIDEKLEHFFQTRTPRQALERLVLARKTNMITACHDVGIDNETEMQDQELINAILWKLGFPIHTGEDPHASFWQRHERLWALAQSSSMGASERFLETAGPYFTELEGLLLDALAFSSWALLVDHTGNDMPFSYDDQDDREEGLKLLQAALESGAEENRFSPDYVSQRIELRNLIEGFRTLAKYLEACRHTPELYRRPEHEFPSFDGKTDLKRFLLRSTVPFLDLSKPSQDRILAGLRQISSTMIDAAVFDVRNDYSHYRRTPPEITRVEGALEAIRQSVTRIENLGFSRLLFAPAGVTVDKWGQSRHEFSGPRSYEHALTRPTNLDWMGLPRLSRAQYLMKSASFGDPNEVLRFTPRYPSEFSRMWSGFPNRRRKGPGAPTAAEQPIHPTGSEVAAS